MYGRKMTISKATIIENVYQDFYTLFNNITGFTNNIYPAFPYKDLDAATSKNSYPIFILNSPDMESWENFTFKKLRMEGTITLDIYTSSAKTCDEYSSDAIDKIETSINTLRGYNYEFIVLDGMTKDVVQRGKINIHFKTIKWRFKFVFDRTSVPY